MIRSVLFPAVMAVFLFAAPAWAQSPAELVEWLRGVGAKVNSQAPTPELLARVQSVSFDGVKQPVPAGELGKLKALKGLKEVGLGNKAGTDAAVAELVKAVPDLERLNVSNSTVTDAAFVELAKLGKLKELSAFGTPITAAALKSIARLPLRRLDISKTAVGDEGLEALKDSSIENLWFNNMKGVTKKGVAALAAMPKLTNLVLQFAELNGEVEELAKSKSLKELTMMSSKLDDVGGVALGKVTTLQNLFLWNTAITDKTVEAISALPLKVLYLDDTKVTDAALESLAKVKTLEVLWIDKTAIGDAGLAHLAGHPTLNWIRAEESKVTDGCVATLVTLPKLASFGARKTAFTDAGVGKLKEKFPKGRFSR